MFRNLFAKATRFFNRAKEALTDFLSKESTRKFILLSTSVITRLFYFAMRRSSLVAISSEISDAYEYGAISYAKNDQCYFSQQYYVDDMAFNYMKKVTNYFTELFIVLFIPVIVLGIHGAIYSKPNRSPFNLLKAIKLAGLGLLYEIPTIGLTILEGKEPSLSPDIAYFFGSIGAKVPTNFLSDSLKWLRVIPTASSKMQLIMLNTTYYLAASSFFSLMDVLTDQDPLLCIRRYDKNIYKRLLAKMPNINLDEHESTQCLISMERMKDPVIVADGFSYDRENILRWFENHNTAPLASQPDRYCVRNFALADFIRSKGECSKEPIFLCRITRRVMNKAVTASDGYSYEESAMRAWIKTKNISPVTKQPLPNFRLLENITLRILIDSWEDNIYMHSYFHTGVSSYISREYQKAICYLNKGLQLQPGLAEAYCLRSFSYYHLGQYQLAVDSLENKVDHNSEEIRDFIHLCKKQQKIDRSIAPMGIYDELAKLLGTSFSLIVLDHESIAVHFEKKTDLLELKAYAAILGDSGVIASIKRGYLSFFEEKPYLKILNETFNSLMSKLTNKQALQLLLRF